MFNFKNNFHILRLYSHTKIMFKFTNCVMIQIMFTYTYHVSIYSDYVHMYSDIIHIQIMFTYTQNILDLTDCVHIHVLYSHSLKVCSRTQIMLSLEFQGPYGPLKNSSLFTCFWAYRSFLSYECFLQEKTGNILVEGYPPPQYW